VDIFHPVWRKCATCNSERLPLLRVVGNKHTRPVRKQIREHASQLVGVADVLLKAIHPEATVGDLRRKFRRRVLRLDREESTGNFEGWCSLVVHRNHTYIGWHNSSPKTTRPTDKELSSMARKVMMQTRVPEDLRNWFKSHCAKNGTTMSAVVTAYMRMLQSHDSGRVPDARQVGR
jgi:hypothetical protein